MRWLLLGLGVLALTGIGGLVASAMSAHGALKLSPRFEWPAACVSGVARTPDGEYVVPLVPVERVRMAL